MKIFIALLVIWTPDWIKFVLSPIGKWVSKRIELSKELLNPPEKKETFLDFVKEFGPGHVDQTAPTDSRSFEVIPTKHGKKKKAAKKKKAKLKKEKPIKKEKPVKEKIPKEKKVRVKKEKVSKKENSKAPENIEQPSMEEVGIGKNPTAENPFGK